MSDILTGDELLAALKETASDFSSLRRVVKENITSTSSRQREEQLRELNNRMDSTYDILQKASALWKDKKDSEAYASLLDARYDVGIHRESCRNIMTGDDEVAEAPAGMSPPPFRLLDLPPRRDTTPPEARTMLQPAADQGFLTQVRQRTGERLHLRDRQD